MNMSVCKHVMRCECKNPGGIPDVGRKAACGAQFWKTSCRDAMLRCSAKVVRLPYDYFSPNIARWNAEIMVTWKNLDFETLTHLWHFGTALQLMFRFCCFQCSVLLPSRAHRWKSVDPQNVQVEAYSIHEQCFLIHTILKGCSRFGPGTWWCHNHTYC